MKSQKQAEREEQQRIKNLVLNYDLRDEGEQHDGEDDFSIKSILQPNPNTKGLQGLERHSASHARSDKSGPNHRSGHRARKLQLSDVDWYGQKPGSRRKRPQRTQG